MRYFIIAATLIAFASAQGGGPWDRFPGVFNRNSTRGYTLDVVHNFRFVDHDIPSGEHLLVAVSNDGDERDCYLIVVADAWEADLEDDTTLHLLTEEVYDLIESSSASATELTNDELHEKYGDNVVLRECFRHTVYELKYTPSADVTGA